MSNPKCEVGDLVMFYDYRSQWSKPTTYSYGMIKKIRLPHSYNNGSRRVRCDIVCPNGKTVKAIKIDGIIILSKIKKEPEDDG